MSETTIAVESNGEQTLVELENGRSALVAALDNEASPEEVDELLEELEIELKHTALVRGREFA
ncbi:MAG: hypothetical protein ABEJ58_09830 [Halodesulfurarchaeum sp.]